MMTLSTRGTLAEQRNGRAIILERVTDAKRAAGLVAQGRHPLIAHVLAHGGHGAALNIAAGDMRGVGADVGLLEREAR